MTSRNANSQMSELLEAFVKAGLAVRRSRTLLELAGIAESEMENGVASKHLTFAQAGALIRIRYTCAIP